jgi:hypothetical protein
MDACRLHVVVVASLNISIAANSSVERVPHMQSASSITEEAPGHQDDCFLGFDLGTSGARMFIIKRRVDDKEEWEYVEVVLESLLWDEGMLRYDNANPHTARCPSSARAPLNHGNWVSTADYCIIIIVCMLCCSFF